MRLTKRIAISLNPDDEYTFFIAGALTPGDDTILGIDTQGGWLLGEDDKFAGTPEALAQYVKQEYPKVKTIEYSIEGEPAELAEKLVAAFQGIATVEMA